MPDSLVGRTLGDFRIEERVGDLYRATQIPLRRTVALRVFPGVDGRFLDEARTLAGLEHPNLMPIYAAGFDAGVHWLATRFLADPGPPLEIRHLAQVAAALAYLHDRGFAHGDLAPGRIRIADGAALLSVEPLRPAGTPEDDVRAMRRMVEPLLGSPAPEYASAAEMRDDLRLRGGTGPVVPPRSVAADAPASEAPSTVFPRSFGKFRILEKLGHGGMGIVYKAEQSDLGRLVALKVLQSDDETLVPRFQREARAAGRLRHPNIVPVYEVGEIEAKPYFTMELVEGRDLDGLRPDTRRAVEIVRDVARAIQYAHDQGIVHRDLKPANVLEQTDGRVLVTDFGLARELGGNRLTVSGEILGTPAYMAPEQARGEAVGTRADVYSIGAILYHLLTGRAPFEGRNPWDVVGRVIEADPVSPRRLNPKLHLDAETICLKAMEKRPAERYASARALAEDCERFLRAEPVEARPIGTLRRAFRRARRHRGLILASTITAAVLLTAAGVWKIGDHRKKTKELATLRAQAATAHAERRWEESERLHRRILDLDPGDASARARADESASTVARIRDLVGQLPGASPVYRIELCTRILALDPNRAAVYAQRGLCGLMVRGTAAESILADLNRALELDDGEATAHLALGIFYRDVRKDLARSQEHFERAAQGKLDNLGAVVAAARLARTRGHPEEALEILRRLSSEKNDPILLNEFGLALHELGRYPEALDHFTRGLEIDPYDVPMRLNRSATLRKFGREDEALAEARRAAEAGPLSTEAHNVVGRICFDLGRLDDALAAFTKAAELDPGDPAPRRDRARVLMDLGRLDDSRAEIARILEGNPDHPSALGLRGRLALREGKLDEAERDLLRAIELGSSDPESACNLGVVYMSRQRFDAALSRFDRALELDRDHREALYNRALALTSLKRDAEAEEAYVRALPGDRTGEYTFALGYFLLHRKRPIEAETRLSEALDKGFARAHFARGSARYDVLDLYGAIEDWSQTVARDPDARRVRQARGNLDVALPLAILPPDPWKGCRPGSWVRFRLRADAPFGLFEKEMTYTLKERTSDAFVWESEKGAATRWSFPAGDLTGVRTDTFELRGERIPARVVRTSKGQELWLSDDVPFGMLRCVLRINQTLTTLDLVEFEKR